MQRPRSQLHLQLGQEVIYVLMTLGLMTTLIVLVSGFGSSGSALPVPPDCALPGRGPCISAIDFPKCMLPGDGPCASAIELPDCMQPERGPCVSAVELPDCMQPGRGPCVSAIELPDCMKPGHGPCVSAIELPDCMQPGHGPCISPPKAKPPILNLTEREGFRFATGSYVIDDQFMGKLRTIIVPEILKLGSENNATVVEVVGHTDSVPMRGAASSLDRELNNYLHSNEPAAKGAEVVDNVGLGMMRAASVARALRNMPELQRHGFVFLTMSAGQTVAPSDRPVERESGQPAGDEARRRVEIRLRRSLR